MAYQPELTYWGWVIIGLVLLGLELIAPFTFFLWLGASALVTALILLMMPDMTWQTQLLTFSVLSITSIVISKRYLVKKQTRSEAPDLNQRAQQYVGRIFTLSEGIEQGEGKIKVDDTHWKVYGPKLKAGSTVRVTGAEGPVFTVEAVD